MFDEFALLQFSFTLHFPAHQTSSQVKKNILKKKKIHSQLKKNILKSKKKKLKR